MNKRITENTLKGHSIQFIAKGNKESLLAFGKKAKFLHGVKRKSFKHLIQDNEALFVMNFKDRKKCMVCNKLERLAKKCKVKLSCDVHNYAQAYTQAMKRKPKAVHNAQEPKAVHQVQPTNTKALSFIQRIRVLFTGRI